MYWTENKKRMVKFGENLGGVWTKQLRTVASLFTKRRPKRSFFETLGLALQTRTKPKRVLDR